MVEAVVAFGRLLFRYRSELAPLTTAAALDLGGLWLHHTYPSWWPALLLVTLGAATAALLRGIPWNVDRPAERRYAAVATAAAGGWLGFATALGPGHGPLQALLLMLMVAAGVPWWTHRRRRARVRVDRTIQAWPDVAESVGLAGSRVLSAVVDVWGWRARVALSSGQTVADAITRVPAIESELGTRAGAVRVEGDPDHAGRITLRVLASDPHAQAVPWTGPQISSVAHAVPLGVFEDATPVRLSVLRRHVLVGGIAGSGKSGILNVVIGNLVACSDVVLWGIDLKGGMELRPWASCFDRVATTPAEATALLHDAVTLLETRAREMGEDSARLWQPSAPKPALVIVIDEYAELPENAPDAVVAADSIGRRGRAVAVTLLAATQRPTQQAMGRGAVRSQMDVRVCLRVRERRDVDLVLGQGMLAAGWHAHTLDAPGKFLVSAEGLTEPRRARAYLVTDEDVRTVAAQYAAGRPILDIRVVRNAAIEAVPQANPEQALQDALRTAPDTGLSVPDLMTLTGMGRTWIYDRLQSLAVNGHAKQVSRGRWRLGR
jgi:S-DNA-T family DNA segregation ATPase FtsK/SpoIIIE